MRTKVAGLAILLLTFASQEVAARTAVQELVNFGRRHLEGVEDTILCNKDEDCPDHPFYICGVVKKGHCGHKEVFPVEMLEIAGIFVFAVIMALSNIAGVGGGGVAIPIIMAMFVFPTKPAIAISSLSIFLTTLARFFFNFRERHPEKHNVVVIDYDLVAIMMPTTLAGAQIGAIILVTFPSIIILIILTLLLGALAVQSFFKAVQLTKKENAARMAAKIHNENQATDVGQQNEEPEKANEDDGQQENDGTKAVRSTETDRPFNAANDDITEVKPDTKEEKKEGETDQYYDPILRIQIDNSMDAKEIKQLRRQIKAESSHFQWAKQALCIFLLLALILMNLMMGSSSMDSIIGIKKCDGAYWGVQFVFLIICIICLVIAVKLAKKDQNLKLKYGGINLTSSDILYSDRKRLMQLLVLGFVGGWVAGALGLGGGSIYNPALLALGIPPKVSSASGLYLVTFSKIASVLIYWLNGQLDVLYGLWIGFWSCVGMLIGLLITQWFMKKTGRQSIIVWCLVVIFIVSTIAVPIFGGISLDKEIDEGLDLWGFSSLCGDKKK